MALDSEEWSPDRRKFYRLAKKDYKRRPTCCVLADKEHILGYFSYDRLKLLRSFAGWYLDSMAKPVSEKISYCPFCGKAL